VSGIVVWALVGGASAGATPRDSLIGVAAALVAVATLRPLGVTPSDRDTETELVSQPCRRSERRWHAGEGVRETRNSDGGAIPSERAQDRVATQLPQPRCGSAEALRCRSDHRVAAPAGERIDLLLKPATLGAPDQGSAVGPAAANPA